MKVTKCENGLIWALRDMVCQHCSEKDGVYDSAFLSSDMRALMILAEYGHIELIDEPKILPSTIGPLSPEGVYGRWVSGRLVSQEQTPNAFGKDVEGAEETQQA